MVHLTYKRSLYNQWGVPLDTSDNQSNLRMKIHRQCMRLLLFDFYFLHSGQPCYAVVLFDADSRGRFVQFVFLITLVAIIKFPFPLGALVRLLFSPICLQSYSLYRNHWVVVLFPAIALTATMQQ